MEIYPKPTSQLSPFVVEQYEKDAKKLWERFYKRHGVNFFKDRHYLHKEFPELLARPHSIILEVGCGVGNSCFPLLKVLSSCQIWAVDFSSHAVDHLMHHAEYNPERIHPVVLDVSEPHLEQRLLAPAFDFCLLVFVLSAISPEKMPQVIQNLKSVLKTGEGRVLFRDYAVGDMAQLRFEEKPQSKKKLGENFYLRGDGTRCYYFTEVFLKSLFSTEDFICEHLLIHERDMENRQQGIRMQRKWIQAVFIRKQSS